MLRNDCALLCCVYDKHSISSMLCERSQEYDERSLCGTAGQLKLASTVQYIPLSVIGGCEALPSCIYLPADEHSAKRAGPHVAFLAML